MCSSIQDYSFSVRGCMAASSVQYVTITPVTKTFGATTGMTKTGGFERGN